MGRISKVHAREVLDSRGNPTVEVEMQCSDGSRGSAIVPSGASTGRAEACELRDGDLHRYDGRGVLNAVRHVNEDIGPALVDRDPAEQRQLDASLIELDGTPQKRRLGANAILGVSLAAAHVAAAAEGVPLYRHLHRLWQGESERGGEGGRGRGMLADPFSPSHPLPLSPSLLPSLSTRSPQLPLPMVNMISGGLHAGGNLDFQDFLILPRAASSFAVGLEWIVRVYRRLGELLSAAGYEGRLVGDEGGYGPRLASNEQAAEFVVRAIEAAGLRPGEDVTLALDVASSHFYDGTHYRLRATGDALLTSEDMIDRLEALVRQFPIESIEDGLAEDDWTGWQEMTRRLGSRVRLVGDDLLATNPRRLQQAIDLHAANSVLIKVNQIGTLSETLETMALAERSGFARVVSARSGETEDATLADLAVAAPTCQIKIGSIVRSERLAKYNRLLRIAEELELGE